VIVGIIVFFELDRLELETGQRLWRWKLVDNLLKFGAVIEIGGVCIWILILLVLISDTYRGKLTGSLSSA
jgi:hypothetical protein